LCHTNGPYDLGRFEEGAVLADSVVEQRFQKLVTTLNSSLRGADGAEVGEPVEDPAPDGEPWYERPSGLGATRLVAIVVAVVALAAGIVVSRSVENGLLVFLLWLAFVVPGVTLGVVFLISRLRR
jgi:hypothetical protein